MSGVVVGAGLMSDQILDAFDGRAPFSLRVPIGAFAFLLALLLVRRTSVTVAAARQLDLGGAVTLFLTLASALLAVECGLAQLDAAVAVYRRLGAVDRWIERVNADGTVVAQEDG